MTPTGEGYGLNHHFPPLQFCQLSPMRVLFNTPEPVTHHHSTPWASRYVHLLKTNIPKTLDQSVQRLKIKIQRVRECSRDITEDHQTSRDITFEVFEKQHLSGKTFQTQTNFSATTISYAPVAKLNDIDLTNPKLACRKKYPGRIVRLLTSL